MGGGSSSQAKAKAAQLKLESENSTSGVPGVKTKWGRGDLDRDVNDKFLYWRDLEEVGFERADTPMKETQAAVRVVVEANNSLVHAVWNVQDSLCEVLNIPVFSLEEGGDAFNSTAASGLNRTGTQTANLKMAVSPCVKRRGRQLEKYEIDDMTDAKINLSENFFFTYWDQFASVVQMLAKNQQKEPTAKIGTAYGHSIEITEQDNDEKMILCSDQQRVNTISYALSRQLVKESIENEQAATIGSMMKPMLDILAKMRDAGKFTSFHLVMAIFPDNEVVDGCIEWKVSPDPSGMKELEEYKDVYEQVFGDDGLFPTLNRCISMLKAASGPLSANPKKVLFLRDAKWKDLCKEAQKDEKDIPIILKKLAENLSKIRHCNVMAPACSEFVKTTFHDLHSAFKEATLLPADEDITDFNLPKPKSEFKEAVVKLKWSAAAQDAAQERGEPRGAGVELDPRCNAGDRPDPNAKKKKEHHKKSDKVGATASAAAADEACTTEGGAPDEAKVQAPAGAPTEEASPPPESPPKATEEVSGSIAAGVVAAAEEEEDDEEGA